VRVFIVRPELCGCWDVSVFVDVRAEEALRRALVRDAALLGGTGLRA
jgi:uridine kinase